MFTAIVVMAKFNKSSSRGSDICATNADNNSNKSHNSGEFDWDESTQGVILGAFFYGYLLFQVLGGRLAELFGAKWLCTGGIAASLVINALTPLIAKSGPYWLLLASRVVLGMFQAFIFPASYALIAKWAPDHERSTFLAMPTMGSNIGTIATQALSGYLAEHGFAGGWPSVFYVPAMIGILWLIVWTVVVKSEPKDHPWISDHELNYIQSNIAANNSRADNKDRPKLSVPWLRICTSKNGLIGSLVYIVLTISGFVADFIIRKDIMDKTLLRKLFETTATIGSGICLAAIPLAGCNDTLAMLACGMIAGGESAVIADISGNFTATVFAIGNTIAFTCGFITPLVIGYILDASDQTRRQWSYIFYMSAALNILGGLVFAIFGSAKRQDWDMDEESVTNDDKIITTI
ncbi:unnamed protein product [Medioppia subpectinata]|uniref:Major facilitator superfamily (MFS) profile domain-containing protein n=1 Tax=Medioppia subpectinata TaxID=1979941 RepID=A0A7R9KEN7_9ACAR|nr:unnamed protein product [Medioppia subpectinata]CAG2102001.1 unnamed protein product [Medioppia subpectinata]